MIEQFKTLTKVKKLREDKAMRALDAARTALQKAQDRAEVLRLEAEESARTLPERERAIYDEILQQVVGLGAVEDAKQVVKALLEQHQKRLDRRDRAFEFVAQCEAKVEEARRELRKRQADVEKIETITEDLETAAAEEQVAREEAEIEDLFSKPVAKPEMGVAEVPV